MSQLRNISSEALREALQAHLLWLKFPSRGRKGDLSFCNLPAIDLCAMAIELGCGYVARSFSGDMKQLVGLLKGAMAHRGTALLDVISPCVTFNNHDTSTKSYKWAKDHEIPIQEIGFIPYYEEITVEYDPGTTQDIELHDGSQLMLYKVDEGHDPRDADMAIHAIRTSAAKGTIVTGLLYVNEDQQDLHDVLGTDERPLNGIAMSELCPGSKALEAINARLS